MGAVETHRDEGLWYKGIYSSTIEKCVYCDKCGSFKISKLPSFRTLLWTTIAALLSVLVWKNTELNVIAFGGIACFVFVTIGLAIDAFHARYFCRKCLNLHITYGNVFHYPENDSSILDTPYKRAVKIYSDSADDYWSQGAQH